MSASQEFFTLERTHAEFEHKLRQAIFFGTTSGHECPTCLWEQTQDAIDRIADEFPNVTFEAVLTARQDFECQLAGKLTERYRVKYEATMQEIAKRNGWT